MAPSPTGKAVFAEEKMKRAMQALLMAAILSPALATAHEGFNNREEVIHQTAYWTGERFSDGRPKVTDDILDKMKRVTLEEAWASLRGAGFLHQYEDGWYTIFPDKILVGRALTSTW